MSLLRQKAPLIREKRLNAIAAYYGKAETLLTENDKEGQFLQRVRTYSQDAPSDILYVLNVIATIKDAAIVVHGGAGCAAARLTFDLFDENNGKWVVTNLNERDSIMGSEVKLRETILQVYKLHSPKIVFIISTPIVAINNDDIESVVDDLKEELGIAIVPVYTDGFRSKVGTTGYDIVSHSIVKRILDTKKNAVANHVNLLSVSEKPEDLKEANRLLQELGLQTNVFPRYASIENIQQAKNASFSIAINADEADYPGKILEDRFEIPYVKSTLPVGIANTSQWLTDIAIATGRKNEVHGLLSREKEKLSSLLKKKDISKRKVFISLTPAYGIALYELLEELGLEVVGVKFTYIDQLHLAFVGKIQAERPDLALFIGDGQLFEEENVIRKIKPDFYVGNASDFAAAIRNGIPVVNLQSISIIGFEGVLNLVGKIRKTLANTSFTQLVAQSENNSYTKEWLKKSTNWFIKQEVK